MKIKMIDLKEFIQKLRKELEYIGSKEKPTEYDFRCLLRIKKFLRNHKM